MNRVPIIALILVTFSAACTNHSNSSNTSVSTNKSSSSFSVSNTVSSQGDLADNALATRSVLTTGGGGGGAREMPLAVTAQKVSLTQAQQIQDAPTAMSRKIIRNAELNLEADSPEESQQKITAIVESKGGFVIESQQSSSDIKTTTHDIVTMTVRVPAEKFGEALEEIRKTASRAIVENIKGEDVTEEFIDIEARLVAQKALEQQFMEIMKRSNSVGEALTVQGQLADVRGEIEKVEGRMRFLENQSSLSIIKIRLQTPMVFTASSSGVFYRLTESFSTGFDFALNFVLGLVTVLVAVMPFALLIGFPGYLIIRYFLKKQRRPMSVSEIAEEEIKSK